MIKSDVLITGGSGFVATEVIKALNRNIDLILPSSRDLDVTSISSVESFFANNGSRVVVNFAAFTNVKEAEPQRGDWEGKAWQINVEGAKNLAEACKKFNKHLIQISTDAVFSMTGTQGPFSEESKIVDNPEEMSWYGYTKLRAEMSIRSEFPESTFVRIAYPFGNLNNPKDYINKLLGAMKAGYPLFADQKLSPTYLPDLAHALSLLIKNPASGVFHVVSRDVATPYDIGVYVAALLGLPSQPKQGSLAEYQKTKEGSSTYSLTGALLSDSTQKRLGLKFHTYQEAIVEMAFISC